MVVMQVSKNQPNKNPHLVNETIPFPQMLVILPNGQKKGPLSKKEALKLADQYELDLIIVAPKAKIPVAKILDYGKYKYDLAKKMRLLKKNTKQTENKEIRLSPNVDVHDLKVKAKKTIEFLEAKSRVKVSLRFRGRQIQHKELGLAKMEEFYSYVADYGDIEIKPTFSNRLLDMYLVAKKQPQKGKKVTQNAQNENKKSPREKS